MLEKVKKIFESDSVSLNYKGIKKALGISRQHKDDELNSILKKLELDGLVYCDELGIYQKFPSNFFVAQVNISTKGFPYIIHNKKRIDLNYSKLDGILGFDTVIFKEENGKVYPIKVIGRYLTQAVCEVKIDDNNNKYLDVCNSKSKVLVRISPKEMKKYVEGERVLVNISLEEFNGRYDGEVVKRIGHRNDLDTELKTIAYNNGFITEYGEDILKEIETIPNEVKPEDLKDRVDKRHDRIFTIDGKYTKDIDDAIEIKMLPNGNYQLIVSIAHVSHYIKPGMALWKFAEANTTSLYFVNSVLAMFHTKLSNGICSLNPDVDRLARSFEMEITPFGDVVNFKTYKSVIHSRKKMTYDDVNEILENDNVPLGYEEYVDDLKLLHKLSKALSFKRKSDGAVDFQNKEVNFKVDEDGKIEKYITVQRAAEKIIENCMVLTNVSVGEHFSRMLLPFVYRNHEFPITDKVKEVYTLLKELEYPLEKINFTDDPLIIQKIIRSLASKEEFIVLSVLVLQAMQRAYYSKDNRGHFGLAVDYYSQSTSPIRRFLDLVIHTLIDYYESLDQELDRIPELENYLERVCTNASIKERCADKAEYESLQLYMVKYMADKIGEEYYGYISDINSTCIAIKTTELIDGACFFDIRNSGYVYYPESKMIVNKSENIDLHIGTKVKVRLSDVDLADRQIKFEIIGVELKDTLIRNRVKKK